MKLKETIFAVIAAIIPVVTTEVVRLNLKNESNLLTALLSAIIAFVLLFVMQFFMNAYNRLNKYCGQWIEEMTQHDSNNVVSGRFIGIGIIRYDRTTREHVFYGKTYTLKGEETYAWAINYLRAERDDSMQYVCSVQLPNERSIGQITFSSKNECEGTIWCMNGMWYKYSAYRINKRMLMDLDLYMLIPKYTRYFLNRSIVISQRYCPELVKKYSQTFFSN